eukprot:TRINITY_DN9661_c0_g1_i1.p2 TRINITY_DN9661_c0_g1~~TRINITY_DN9661_c0_g1_i1.p2  ORF type:complete len:70 (+),score=0.32 TRINITY_DN9661_c0_g1_i1:222-431(+)
MCSAIFLTFVAKRCLRVIWLLPPGMHALIKSKMRKKNANMSQKNAKKSANTPQKCEKKCEKYVIFNIFA